MRPLESDSLAMRWNIYKRSIQATQRRPPLLSKLGHCFVAQSSIDKAHQALANRENMSNPVLMKNPLPVWYQVIRRVKFSRRPRRWISRDTTCSPLPPAIYSSLTATQQSSQNQLDKQEQCIVSQANVRDSAVPLGTCSAVQRAISWSPHSATTEGHNIVVCY